MRRFSSVALKRSSFADVKVVRAGITRTGVAGEVIVTPAAMERALSIIARPPQRQEAAGLLTAAISLAGTVIVSIQHHYTTALILGGLGLAGTASFLYRVYRYNTREFPKRYRQWERSYVCEHCRSVIVV